MADTHEIARNFPDRISELRRFLNDAAQRLGGSPSTRDLVQTASLLTSVLVSTLNESGECLTSGIARLDSKLATSREHYEKQMASLQATAERAQGLEPEWAAQSLAALRATHTTIDTAYELALKQDQVAREFFLSYHERWSEAVYLTFDLFASDHQREQLETLLKVLVGMIPYVGTVCDSLDLLLSLRPAAVDPGDFKGVSQFERYSNSCQLLLVLFEILADIASGTVSNDDLGETSVGTRMEVYQLSLGDRVDKRIQRLLAS